MFEIEDSWTCKSFGVNWVCHHYLDSNSQPAFIFTTARMALPSEQLKLEKLEKNEDSSLLNPAKKVSINNHVWIDSFYQNRFYKNVLSRFERTVCCDDLPEKFQVLVGFHAFKENYPKYASSFLKAIRSLNLLTSNLEEIKRLLKRQTNQQGQDMNNYIQNILFENSEETASLKEKKSFTGFFLLIFCLVCVLGIIYYRKKRVKKSSKRRKSK
ncbi:MAG: hypothetical protein OXJ52_06390 [Oligoflexia bacterium]|nr:hypothetical protein [Oligoflexia bacterium]